MDMQKRGEHQKGCDTCAHGCDQHGCSEHSGWVPRVVEKDGKVNSATIRPSPDNPQPCESCWNMLHDRIINHCTDTTCIPENSQWVGRPDAPLPNATGSLDTEARILRQCEKLGTFLAGKNRAYGDSAINPKRIFAKSDAIEQIKVRLDDKLNRMLQGKEYPSDDTLKDFAGYYILLEVAKEVHGHE